MPANETFFKSSNDGLKMVAYPGDASVLLAFDLDDTPGNDFAGFSIKCTPPEGEPYFLANRINFTKGITSETTPSERKFTSSDKAPFQKFRWLHVPSVVSPGEYIYEVATRHFSNNGGLNEGTSTAVAFEMTPEKYKNFEMGFTRGYISSQAYAEKFHNAAIRPAGDKTLDYDTSKFNKRYEWLGFHARKMLMSFLDECIDDDTLEVDLFAYDIDEPDIVSKLEKLGTRLRAFLDNASLHTGDTALEPEVHDRLVRSAGESRVKVGHFRRFAHNKVLIQKKGDTGTPVKVLTGSANFSVRGLYVQANNILIFNDSDVARLYEEAFEQAFRDKSKTQSSFDDSEIASRYFDINVADCPRGKVAFSPHQDSDISLKLVSREIENADNSVMFAIMEIGGTGPVLDQIRKLDTTDIFTYGVTQSSRNLGIYKAGSTRAKLVPFAYLKDKVPEPFRNEYSGGQGQVIHHKFIVVDFNDSDPVVFTGSSNLAAGGEKANGDNLMAVYDRGIATAYAVEAVRLIDHYDFRWKMKTSTKEKPFMLTGKESGKQKWWKPYFDKDQIKYHDRLIFSQPAR